MFMFGRKEKTRGNGVEVAVTQKNIGFCSLLFIILLLLKVGVVETTVMGWSWWWISLPLWGPACLFFGIISFFLLGLLAIFLGGLLISVITTLMDKKRSNKQNRK